MKEYLAFLGGVVGVSVLLHYAYAVVRGKAKADSVATWCMWTMLDMILLATTWQAGKPVWLPLGWTLGASLVTISLIQKGEWKWKGRETLAAICALGAAALWLTQGAIIGVIAGTMAMTCAGTPLLLDMIKKPVRDTFPVWSVTCIACLCTLLASDWSLAGTFLPWSSLAYNGTLSILSLRNVRNESLA